MPCLRTPLKILACHSVVDRVPILHPTNRASLTCSPQIATTPCLRPLPQVSSQTGQMIRSLAVRRSVMSRMRHRKVTFSTQVRSHSPLRPLPLRCQVVWVASPISTLATSRHPADRMTPPTSSRLAQPRTTTLSSRTPPKSPALSESSRSKPLKRQVSRLATRLVRSTGSAWSSGSVTRRRITSGCFFAPCLMSCGRGMACLGWAWTN